MNYFLSGGAKNGKSSLAQEIVCAQSGPHYYLATMTRTTTRIGCASGGIWKTARDWAFRPSNAERTFSPRFRGWSRTAQCCSTA